MTKKELIEALEPYDDDIEINFTYGKRWYFWLIFFANLIWAVYQLYLGNTNNLIFTCTTLIIMSTAIN